MVQGAEGFEFRRGDGNVGQRLAGVLSVGIGFLRRFQIRRQPRQIGGHPGSRRYCGNRAEVLFRRIDRARRRHRGFLRPVKFRLRLEQRRFRDRQCLAVLSRLCLVLRHLRRRSDRRFKASAAWAAAARASATRLSAWRSSFSAASTARAFASAARTASLRPGNAVFCPVPRQTFAGAFQLLDLLFVIAQSDLNLLPTRWRTRQWQQRFSSARLWAAGLFRDQVIPALADCLDQQPATIAADNRATSPSSASSNVRRLSSWTGRRAKGFPLFYPEKTGKTPMFGAGDRPACARRKPQKVLKLLFLRRRSSNAPVGVCRRAAAFDPKPFSSR